MNYPIPPGTRDILPDEMKELRALSTALLETFLRFGYGEVWTPTMEFENVLIQGDERAAGVSYRLFDEHGQVLALRSDMTIPIARLVATRYEGADLPCASVTCRTPTGRSGRSAASSASSCRRNRADRCASAPGDGRGDRGPLRRARRGWAAGRAWASATPGSTAACWRASAPRIAGRP